MNNYILEYYQAIHDGVEIVGMWIMLLYNIIVQGLQDGVFYYDGKKANNAIRFIEQYCRHNKGKMAPQLLKLNLWQKAFISLLFGIVDADGRRQFREVVLVVGRKCGKTLLAAAIITYIAYVDGEFGSEIYCIAPKLDQSELVYSAFQFNVDNSPALSRKIKPRKNDLYIKESNTSIKKIAFNDRKADGYNPMLTVCDEGSSWPAARGLRQYEVMMSGTGAREEPIMLMISSSGYVDEGIYDELIKRGTSFLKGNSSEKHILPVLYMIDDITKWDDINELHKSLPGLGVSVSVDFLLNEIDVARGSLSKKSEFITKYCNLKQNSSQAWMRSEWVQHARCEHLDLRDYEDCYAVLGLDLSRSTDLTCALLAIERGDHIDLFAKFWLPKDKLQEAIERDQLPYDLYVERGLLELSGNNYIDYADAHRWCRELVSQYHIYPLYTGYDRYNALQLTQAMQADGFLMDGVTQGENLTPVINEVEGLMRDGRFRIGDNDLLAVHLLDSALHINNQNGRKKLVKLAATRHIDGTAALLDAMCMRQAHFDEIGQRLKNAG